jgi:threonine/homoserine/homoserine lactone efflux protein
MGFIEIFGFSFLIALTGAMSPGSVLTYTIYKSIQAGKKSYQVGLFLILGHALLEFSLILLILTGMAPFISQPNVIITIGLIGGCVLIYFGLSIIMDVKRNRINADFLNGNIITKPLDMNSGKPTNSETISIKKIADKPFFGGILMSLSNPFWILWWAVVGLGFMTQFSVVLSNPINFWAFFMGHEAGDAIWYIPIAIILGFTNKFMTKKVYFGILICCAIFMIVFGLNLAIKPFFGL